MVYNVMPPSLTPGDDKGMRQGASPLFIAGEKTRAPALWGLPMNKSGVCRFFTESFSWTADFCPGWRDVLIPWVDWKSRNGYCRRSIR